MDEENKLTKALNTAYRLLYYQSRSKKELELKLSKKGFKDNIIRKAIAYLQEKNYINDLKFAREWGQSKITHNYYGKYLLERELLNKGIEAEITQEVIEELYRDKKEAKVAEQLSVKKMKLYKNLDTEVAKRRLVNLLRRKGFTPDTFTNMNWDHIFTDK